MGELDALRANYEAHRPWLKPSTRLAVEKLSDGFERRCLDFAAVLWANNADPRTPYDEDEAAASVYEWAREDAPGGLHVLKQRF